jgi:hypothetical protein
VSDEIVVRIYVDVNPAALAKDHKAVAEEIQNFDFEGAIETIIERAVGYSDKFNVSVSVDV